MNTATDHPTRSTQQWQAADAAHFLDPGDPGHGAFAQRALRLYDLINGGLP